MKVVRLASCIGILALLPGCPWKKHAEHDGPRSVALPQERNKADDAHRTLFLDDEMDELVFEEDDTPPDELSPEDSAVRIVHEENSADGTRVERQQDQVTYGFVPLRFGFDSYRVVDSQHGTLMKENVAAAKKACKRDRIVVVEGHACNSAGSREYNMHLSEKRAQAVAQALVAEGVPVDCLKIVGRGVEMPIVPHGNREQQAPNRRVELYTAAPSGTHASTK